MDRGNLEKLINNFRFNLSDISSTNSSYTESDVRSEFIDPLFEILGWDMNNKQGLSLNNKEVIRENFRRIDEETSQIPDYTFRVKSTKKFFVEAKKPSVNIKKKDITLQVRKYGYSAGLPISAVTNFFTTRIFDTRIEPKILDDEDNSLLFECKYEDYLNNFDSINKFLGKQNVFTREWDKLVKNYQDERPLVNKNFLSKINNWRLKLASVLNDSSKNIDIGEINFLSQKILNRFIFIRVCEDRRLVKSKELKECLSLDVESLLSLFGEYNDKFNTNIFKLNHEESLLKKDSVINVLKDIIKELYHPYSPYNFAVLDAEFFGDIYEDYLTKVLTVSLNKIILTEKKEYTDRGVVSTPNMMVSKVVEETLNEFFKRNKNIPRVLDPAVGSGRFLLSTYDYLLTKYENNINSINNKITILKSLFGIDKDYLAVETAKFSLYMKVLENENYETLNNLRSLLPDLEKNIIFGNSIIDTDFQHILNEIQPLKWEVIFDNKKFDIIIGNPPYEKTETIRKIIEEFNYLKRKYQTSFKQFDKYFSFIEKSLNYLNLNGLLSFVIPNKWINNVSGSKLRSLIDKKLYRLINFGNEIIFKDRSNYVCFLLLSNNDTKSFEYSFVDEYKKWLSDKANYISLDKNDFNFNKPLILPSNEDEKIKLKKLFNKSMPLGKENIYTGIQTSKDEIYVISDFIEDNNYILFQKNKRNWKIEKNICRPYISNSQNIKKFQILKSDSYLIFPYYIDQNGKTKIINLDSLKKEFPKTYEYFLFYKEQLLERDITPAVSKDLNDFYKYGRSQNIFELSKKPKLILTVNQTGEKYSLDYSGLYYTAGGTAGEISIYSNDENYIYYILGLLDQEEVEFFLRKRGSSFRGGYFSRGKDVMSDLPVPVISTTEDKKLYNEIILNIKNIIDLKNKPQFNTQKKLISDNSINLHRERVKNLFRNLWSRTS
jgi:hypothetical protein